MDHKLLDILVCPVTGAALEELDEQRRAALNKRVETSSLRYADGSAVEAPLTAALVTADAASVYRVDDDIPVLLPDRAIPLDP